MKQHCTCSYIWRYEEALDCMHRNALLEITWSCQNLFAIGFGLAGIYINTLTGSRSRHEPTNKLCNHSFCSSWLLMSTRTCQNKSPGMECTECLKFPKVLNFLWFLWITNSPKFLSYASALSTNINDKTNKVCRRILTNLWNQYPPDWGIEERMSYESLDKYTENSAARLLTRTKRSVHTTPVLRTLRWLPVHQRIVLKAIPQVCTTLHDPKAPK